MSVGLAKEREATMIKRAVIDSVVIHKTLVGTRQTPDARIV
jgi:hypothetical protein